jgi:hypothetical protein
MNSFSSPSFGNTGSGLSFGNTAPGTTFGGSVLGGNSQLFGNQSSSSNTAISFGGAPSNSTNASFGTTLQASTPNSGFGFSSVNNNSLNPMNSTANKFSTGLGFGNIQLPNNAAFSSSGFGKQGPNAGFGAPPLFSSSLSTGSSGALSEVIEKLLKAYAPIRDFTNGNYKAGGEGKRSDECHFKTVKLSQKSSASSLTHSSPLISNESQQATLLYGSLLEEAEKDVIDPSLNCILVEEAGVDLLFSRFENQNTEIKNMSEYTGKLKLLAQVVSDSNRELMSRIHFQKMKQISLNQKLLKIIRKIEVLRCTGNPLQSSEVHYKKRLLQLIDDIQCPKMNLEDLSMNLVSLSPMFLFGLFAKLL